MSLIRTTCSECGDIEMRSKDLQVRICGDTGDGTYLFRCPVCRMTEVKNADDQTIDILAAAGVRCIEWRLPIELLERPSDDGVVDVDSLIEFHESAQSKSAFEAALRALDEWMDVGRYEPIEVVLSFDVNEMFLGWSQFLHQCWLTIPEQQRIKLAEPKEKDFAPRDTVLTNMLPNTSADPVDVCWEIVLHRLYPLPPEIIMPPHFQKKE